MISPLLILVVDDKPDMRELITLHLNKAGFNTIEAAHGEEALAQVLKHPLDLIISDHSCPR